jgi:hypothetical protein
MNPQISVEGGVLVATFDVIDSVGDTIQEVFSKKINGLIKKAQAKNCADIRVCIGTEEIGLNIEDYEKNKAANRKLIVSQYN